jgi:hypothetical protein
MTTNNRPSGRRIRVRAIRRDPPDLRKLSRAFIELALHQARLEAEAQNEHKERKEKRRAA